MNKFVYLLIIFISLISSCSSEEVKEENKKVVLEEKQENSGISFNIPSPSEQFELIAELDGIKDVKLVNDPKRSYQGSKIQSLNFGVYIADIAYLTSFDEASKYLQFFNQLEKVGKDLGVSDVFSKDMGDLIKKWGNTPDSLFKLSNDTYSKSFQKLIDIDKGNELSLMLAGGWIETMHLIVGTSKGFGLSPKIDKILIDQKLVAENLIDFMIDYQDNKDVSDYMVKMSKVLDLYLELDCTNESTDVKENNGKITISGGETCSMNKATFSKIKTQIQALREEIVK
jgi:hypothetical protein